MRKLTYEEDRIRRQAWSRYQNSVWERVGSLKPLEFLLLLAIARRGKYAFNAKAFYSRISVSELVEMTGMSKSSVTRYLRSLMAKKQLVRLKNGSAVHNLAALYKIPAKVD